MICLYLSSQPLLIIKLLTLSVRNYMVLQEVVVGTFFIFESRNGDEI